MGMFSNAQTVNGPKASKKKDSAPEMKVEGLEQYAALDYLEKAIKTVKKTLEADVKGFMMKHFVKEGCTLKRRPVNFKGLDGVAEASCQLKDRGENSPLSEAEIALLSKHKIAVREVEVVCDTFVINPEYCANAYMLAKVEKALAKAGLPSDFFMKQVGVKKIVVDSDELDKAFALKPDLCAQLLPVMTTPAIRAKIKVENMEQAFNIVADLLQSEEE